MQSLAVGSRNITSGAQSTGVGNDVRVTGNSAIGIGADDSMVGLNAANASGTSATYRTVTGATLPNPGDFTPTLASGNMSMAIGVQSQATADFSTVFGWRSTASAVGSLAVGDSTIANGIGASAFGAGATATARNSLALGDGSVANRLGLAGGLENFSGTAVASTQGAVSVGAAGAERQIANVAGGTLATDAVNVRQLQAVGANLAGSLGGGAVFNPATGAYTAPTYTVAGQPYNNVGGALAALTGGSTTAGVKYFHANSAGPDSVATGGEAIAVGSNATALGNNSVAIGGDGNALNAANAAGQSSVAIGDTSKAIGGYATAVGIGSTAQAQGSAFGEGASAGPTAIAAGFLSSASGPNSTALGGTANAAGQYSLAAGTSASALGQSSTALGNDARAVGAQSVAIGGSGGAGSANAAQALAATGVAIGAKSTATNVGDVALGANATTVAAVGTAGATIGGTAYVFAGTTPTSTVSVGAVGAERTITNVAAGRLSGTSTDAVNGSQLYATNRAVGANATSIATLGSTTAATFGSGATYNAATGITGFNSSVAGGTQTNVGSALTALDTAARTQGTGLANALGGGAAVAPNGTVTAPTFAVGAANYATVASALTAVQTGAPVQYSTAGAPTTPNGFNPSNDVTLVGANPAAPVALHNVAAGMLTATSTDAVNGSQLYATNQTVTNLANGTAGLVQQNPVTRAITVGAGTDGASVGFANNAGTARTLTGVAAGQVAAGSTQGVNGGQLYGTAASVAAGLGGGSAVNPDGTLAAPTYNVAGQAYNNVGGALDALTGGSTTAGVKYFHANSTGPDSSATGADAVAIGSGATATQAGGIALGSGATADRAGLAGATESFSGTAVASTQGAVSVGAAGAERQITNLAGGTQATDAVNVRQLQAVGSNLAGSLGGGAAFDPATGAYTAPAFATAAGTTATTVQAALGNETAAITSLGNGTAGKLGGGTGYSPATGLLTGGFTVNGTTYGDVASAIAGASADDGLVQRTGTPNQVAVTAPGGTGANPGAAQVVTNVAAGQVAAGSTQAVNGGQLYGTAASVASGLGGGSTVNPNGTVSAPAYTVGGQTYGNVGSALTASGALGVQYVPNAAGAPTNAVDLTKGGTLAPVSVTGLANATAPSGAVALAQMPTQYSSAGAPTTANPAVPSNDVTLVGANAAAPVALHNVAAGMLTATSTDAVNGSQLYATNQTVTNLANGTAGLVQQDPVTRAITVGAGTDGASVGFANNAGTARTLTGVAAGQVAAGSTQGVNGGQLYGTAASVAAGLGGGSAVNPDGTLAAPTYNVAGQAYNNVGGALDALTGGSTTAGVKYFHANSTGPDSSATGADAVAIGSGATATQAGGIALGSGATADRAGLAGATESFSGTAVASTQGAVSVGAAGAERQITNLAGGTQATDAVNVRQLQAVGSNLAGSLGGGAAFDPATGAYTAPAFATAAGTTATTVQAALGNETAAITSLGNGTAGKLGGGTGYSPATGLLTGGFTVNGTTYGDVASAIAGASADDGLVQRTGTPNQVAVTAPGGTGANPGAAQVVTNVAAGQVAAGSTQAVNGGQLYGTAASVASGLGGGSTVNPNGTVSAPAYTVGGQTYGNVGSALTASGALGVQYVPNAAGAPTNAVDLTKGGTLAPVSVTGLANATAPSGAVALAQMPTQYSSAGAPTTANPAVPSNDVTLVGANAAAPVALHNVAAGMLTATSTDAVNGSQLYATNQTVTNLANGTAGLVQQDPVTRAITVGAGTDGASVGFANNAGTARTLTGVAAGQVAAGSTQAVNGGQLYGTAVSVAAGLGGGAKVNPDGTIAAPTYAVAGATYTNVGGALSALDNGLSSGKLGAFTADDTAGRPAPVSTGANAAAGGFGASATGAGSTVLGSNASDGGTTGASILGSNGSVTAANGVALGTGSAATRAGLGGATEAFTGTAVASTQGAISVGSAGNERQITNVAGGTQATDAVNLRQLTSVGSNLAGSLGGGAGFDPATGVYTAPTYAVGGQTYGDVGSAIAASNGLAVQYTPGASGAATNAIDLTKGGTLGNVSLVGIASGALTPASTAAVNGSQLYATNQQIAALAGGQAGLVQQDATTRAITVGAGTDGTSVGFANNAGAARTLTGVAAGQVAAGSTQGINGGQLYGTTQSVAAGLGGGASVNPDGTLSAPNYVVGGSNYASVGGAVAALDNTGVKYDVVPTTGARGQSITLAGGDPNQPVLIRNVASGVARSDGANFGQVQDAQAAAAAYTNQQVGGVEGQISGINSNLSGLQNEVQQAKREARTGAAIGLAAGSLRYDDRPGKLSVAAGGGYWRGEAASAFGVGYTLPNGAFRLNGAMAVAGSNVGAGVGASYTFN